MRAGTHAGAAGETELLPFDDRVADVHADDGEVGVERSEPVAHVDEHHVAVTLEALRVPGRCDPAGTRCGDVERAQRADVDSGMPLGTVVAVPARNDPARGPLQ